MITFLKTPSVLNTKHRLEKSVNVPKTVKTFENSDDVFENTKRFEQATLLKHRQKQSKCPKNSKRLKTVMTFLKTPSVLYKKSRRKSANGAVKLPVSYNPFSAPGFGYDPFAGPKIWPWIL